jgi:hypothetical protein
MCCPFPPNPSASTKGRLGTWTTCLRLRARGGLRSRDPAAGPLWPWSDRTPCDGTGTSISAPHSPVNTHRGRVLLFRQACGHAPWWCLLFGIPFLTCMKVCHQGRGGAGMPAVPLMMFSLPVTRCRLSPAFRLSLVNRSDPRRTEAPIIALLAGLFVAWPSNCPLRRLLLRGV